MKNLLPLLLLALSFNAYAALTFPTIITATGISSINSLSAAQANRIALQNAVNSCTDPLGCTVRIIDKDAFVEAAAQDCVSSGLRGVSVPSNVRVSLARTYLRVYPNKCQSYSVFRFWGVHDSELVMDRTTQIIGDKITHDYAYTGQPCSSAGATHECGHLVSVTDSQHIKILYGVLTLATGDGLYIGGDNSLGDDITVNYVHMDNNRRQGMSIISGANITVEKNYFTNTGQSGKYIAPGLGLDIEVNGCAQRVVNLTVQNNNFSNNYGGGFKAYSPVCPNDRTITTDDVYQNVNVNNNTFYEINTPVQFSNAMNILFEANAVVSQAPTGIDIEGSADINVIGNTFTHKLQQGVVRNGTFVYAPANRPNVFSIIDTNFYKGYQDMIIPADVPPEQVSHWTNILRF